MTVVNINIIMHLKEGFHGLVHVSKSEYFHLLLINVSALKTPLRLFMNNAKTGPVPESVHRPLKIQTSSES